MAIESQESSVERQEPVRDDRRPPAGSSLPAIDRFARRVIIEHLQPEIDAGRFPIKRTVGEMVDVSATIFTDRQDVIVDGQCRSHSHRSLNRITHQASYAEQHARLRLDHSGNPSFAVSEGRFVPGTNNPSIALSQVRSTLEG